MCVDNFSRVEKHDFSLLLGGLTYLTRMITQPGFDWCLTSLLDVELSSLVCNPRRIFLVFFLTIAKTCISVSVPLLMILSILQLSIVTVVL